MTEKKTWWTNLNLYSVRRGEQNVKDSLRFTLCNKVATPIVYISFP